MGVTGWRKRHQFLLLRQRLIAAALRSCAAFTPSQSYSEGTANKDECIALELDIAASLRGRQTEPSVLFSRERQNEEGKF